MRKSHLDEMKTFLIRISQDKVTNNAFDNCKVMEYVENEMKITHQNNNVENNDNEQKEDFILLDNIEHELNNITEGNSIQDQELGKNRELDQNKTSFEKEPINKLNPINKDIPELQEVSSTETPSSKPKGARSVDFLETKSTMFNDIEVPVKSESSHKDSTVSSSNRVDKDMSDESRHNIPETSDEIFSDDASTTVSKQAMVSWYTHQEGAGQIVRLWL
jgi:hypothetical protein